MKYSFKTVLIFIFLILKNVAFSQTPPYYHYTSSDGLSSSTVYSIIQDKKGFIWFATSNGVSRFDGRGYINYGTNDGLNSNQITSLLEGENGEIYMSNYEKGINIIKDGKIEKYPIPENIQLDFLFREQYKIYAYKGTRMYELSEGKSNQILDSYNKLIDNKICNFLKLIKISDGNVLALTDKGLYSFRNDMFTSFSISGLNDKALNCMTEGKDGTIYAGGKGKIYVIKNYSVITEIKISENEKVFQILSDRTGNLWFSIVNKGLFMIPAGKKEIINTGKKLNLQSTQINSLFEDVEGNIWIGTFGKGVYCFHNLYFSGYSESDGLSNNNVQSIICCNNNSTIIGTFNGLNILKDNKFNIIRSGESNLTDFIYKIKIFNNSVYVSTPDVLKKVNRRGKNEPEIIFVPNSAFCLNKDGYFLRGGWANEIYFQNQLSRLTSLDSQIIVYGDEKLTNRITGIIEDTKGNIWIGSVLGVCRIKDNKKNLFPENEVLNNTVLSIIQDNRNKVWFAGDNGAVSYDLDSDSITTLKSISGYNLLSLTSVAVDKKDRIWFGSMKGLYRYDGNSVKYFDVTSGLPSNEVLCLCYDKNRDYMDIGTSNGICFLDISLFDSYSPEKLNLQITGIIAGDSVYSDYGDIKLSHSNNHIRLDFSAINFSSPGSLKYEFKLNDDEWEELTNNYIDLLDLRSGDYQVVLKAKNITGEWSEARTVSFKIYPPVYGTVWFLILAGLVITGIVSGGAWMRIRHMKNKISRDIEIREKIAALKHHALAAMMNPHFIFNSLNSVQYLVNRDKPREASDYISYLGQLVRMNLENAMDNFILMSEEIKRLELYISLEKLRFEDKFSYEITCGDMVDPDKIEIPNMVIQPFVENSILHGLSVSDTKGFVKVTFDFEIAEIDGSKIKLLVIRIIDNGVGTGDSKKYELKGHSSKAISIIKERFRLLCKHINISQPLIINDLGRRNPGAHGTEVIISLPPGIYKTVN